MKPILIFILGITLSTSFSNAQTFDEDWAAYIAKLKGRKGGYSVQVKLTAINSEGKPDHTVDSDGSVKIWGNDYYMSSFNKMTYLVTPEWHIIVDKGHKKIIIKSLQNVKKKPEAFEKPVSSSQKAEKTANGYRFSLGNGGSCQTTFSDGLLSRVLYENTGGMKRTEISYTYQEANFSKQDFSEDIYIRKEKSEWKTQPAYSDYKLIIN
ncbi:MAG: hypothetical protein IBJ09_12085 [Bacteroidia bacterium]|nr:hypothetical protein [Bacteroidia bacterium]